MSNNALVKAVCSSEGDVYLDFLFTDDKGSNKNLLDSVLKILRVELQDSGDDGFRAIRLRVVK